jgi:hypothetical protein
VKLSRRPEFAKPQLERLRHAVEVESVVCHA